MITRPLAAVTISIIIPVNMRPKTINIYIPYSVKDAGFSEIKSFNALTSPLARTSSYPSRSTELVISKGSTLPIKLAVIWYPMVMKIFPVLRYT